MSSDIDISNDILTVVDLNTKAFLETIPKNKRKIKGQFFTSRETAEYMAGMFCFDSLPQEISILDPGAGSGILSAAIVEKLNNIKTIKSISIDCYETDPLVYNLLKDNLDYVKQKSRVSLNYKIVTEDYILSQQDAFNKSEIISPNHRKYDLVISNPPYLKINRDDPLALSMPKVVHGAPNMYFLFASMSLFNLKPNCEMVYIIPRSWTSGSYFARFRDYLLSEGVLTHIHLFVSRDKVFSNEEVLQETIIIKIKKSKSIPSLVRITSSNSNSDFRHITSIDVEYSMVVAGDEKYVFLPTNKEDIEVIRKIHSFKHIMPEEGIRMKTGIVVDFRQGDELRIHEGNHIIPLFYSQHIRDGRVHHQPSGREYDWIIDTKPGLIQKNKNYVFLKRFTAKEEKRRLQCGIYLSSDFQNYQYIATQNKINFIDSVDNSDLDTETIYGVYALLNSTLFDKYYRILNGSTQVNSTEINNIPIPPIMTIKTIGKQLLKSGNLSTAFCDKLLEKVYE